MGECDGGLSIRMLEIDGPLRGQPMAPRRALRPVASLRHTSVKLEVKNDTIETHTYALQLSWRRHSASRETGASVTCLVDDEEYGLVVGLHGTVVGDHPTKPNKVKVLFQDTSKEPISMYMDELQPGHLLPTWIYLCRLYCSALGSLGAGELAPTGAGGEELFMGSKLIPQCLLIHADLFDLIRFEHMTPKELHSVKRHLLANGYDIQRYTDLLEQAAGVTVRRRPARRALTSPSGGVGGLRQKGWRCSACGVSVCGAQERDAARKCTRLKHPGTLRRYEYGGQDCEDHGNNCPTCPRCRMAGMQRVIEKFSCCAGGPAHPGCQVQVHNWVDTWLPYKD